MTTILDPEWPTQLIVSRKDYERLYRVETAARDARNALALTYTNVPEDGRPHWCRFSEGHHDATCSGMLGTQDALRAALDEVPA